MTPKKACVLLLCLVTVFMCGCEDSAKYELGSGTASRNEITIKDDLEFNEGATASGDWIPAEGTAVSGDISDIENIIASMFG